MLNDRGEDESPDVWLHLASGGVCLMPGFAVMVRFAHRGVSETVTFSALSHPKRGFATLDAAKRRYHRMVAEIIRSASPRHLNIPWSTPSFREYRDEYPHLFRSLGFSVFMEETE